MIKPTRRAGAESEPWTVEVHVTNPVKRPVSAPVTTETASVRTESSEGAVSEPVTTETASVLPVSLPVKTPVTTEVPVTSAVIGWQTCRFPTTVDVEATNPERFAGADGPFAAHACEPHA